MAEDNQEVEFFKEKLFSNFKEAGLLDHLKSQMRYNILEKLQKKNLAKDTNKENRNTINQSKENALNFRILISIISDFLEFHGYNYTQAVFLPEAKYTNQTLTKREIIDILHLNKISNPEDPSPLLTRIVDYIDNQLDTNKAKFSVQCQTDFEGRNVNLEDKLRNIDYEYLQKIDGERLSTQQSFDEKMIKFKREYDQRMKAELNAEIARIREFELANIRLDEAEKYRIKSEQYREELDRVYTEKLQRLKERERDTIERCKHQLKNLEVASYDYRQKFLKDHEIHKMKEDELEKHLKMEKETLRAQRERLQELERDLQQQQRDLDDQKKYSLRKTEEFRVMNIKPETYKEFEEDKISSMKLKVSLENEINKAEQYKIASENYESQNRRLLEENNQLTEEVRRLRESKREIEAELDRTKDSLRELKKSLEKNEGLIQHYDKQIQRDQEEINQNKIAVQEYKDMLQQRKREQIEANQKFIKEIEFYQNEIEKLERERDTLKRRIHEMETEYGGIAHGHYQPHTQTVEMGIQKDSYRTTHRPTLDQSRLSTLHNHAAPHYQNSYRFEENDNPLRKLEALERDIKELRDHREQQILGVHTRSAGKAVKAHSSSPRFDRDKHSSRIDDIESSPQFNPYLPKPSDDLAELERQKRNLKNELKQMIGLDESRKEISLRFDEESFSMLKTSDVKKDHFDHIFDKYTDKMLRESGPMTETKDLPSAGKLKYEDFAPSGTKGEQHKKSEVIPSKHEESSRGRDIFKVDSPSPIQKQELKPKYDNKYDIEEMSQKSNRSLVESFSEDHPKPIIFKKETAPKKVEKEPLTLNPITSTQKSVTKIQEEPKPKTIAPISDKKAVKEEIPSTLGSLSNEKKESGFANKLRNAGKLETLTLPEVNNKKGKDEPKKQPQQRSNAAIDSILGDQRKITDEVDFEEFDEEIFDL